MDCNQSQEDMESMKSKFHRAVISMMEKTDLMVKKLEGQEEEKLSRNQFR